MGDDMSDASLAETTASAVSTLSSGFMLDGATYKRGAQLGFQGIDFYFAGRCGVLGDVGADVATSALAFFAPETVQSAWDSSRDVMPRAEASAAFAGCLEQWALDHLGEDVDWVRLGELAREVVAAATVAGAPLFAAWRAAAQPTDVRAEALFRMNLLRELRMARHASAVVALGLDPGDAVRHRSPQMLGVFGWPAADVDDSVADRWSEAERLTNLAFDHDLAVLHDEQRVEFAALCAAALASVH